MMGTLRLGAAIAGLVFAVAAVAMDDRRLGWVGIALLLAAVVLRFLARRRDGDA